MIMNKGSKKIVLVLFLLLSGIQMLTPYFAQASTQQDKPRTPEIPKDAQRFNMTELVPHSFTHMFTVGSQQVLQFRNMNIQINASRNIQLNITAEPELTMRYLHLNLHLNRSLTLNIRAHTSPPADVPRPTDGLGRYITIEPNASAQIRATLRLYIDEETLAEELGRNLWMERLRWAFWNGVEWEPVESWMDDEGFLVAETNHFSTWTIRETKGRMVPTPDIPGVPSRTRAYNYTDVTPQRFTWTIRERECTMFMFRRTAMMFNCTKNLDLNLTMAPDVEHRLFSLHLNPAEPMLLRIQMETNAPEGIEPPQRGIGLFLDIEPNATTPVNARIRLQIDQDSIEAQMGREINVTALKWAYWHGSEWVEVESHLDENDILEAETDHFSTWTILETEETGEEPPKPEPPTGKTQTWLTYGGILAIVIGIAALLLVMRRNT